MQGGIMRYSFTKYAAAAAVAAGIIFAQTPPSDPQPGPAKTHEWRPGSSMRGYFDMDRVAQALNLTDAQKKQAQTIFQQAEMSGQPIRQEMRQNREKLSAAAKINNNEAEIQKLAAEQGRLVGKLIAIRTVASARFYQILTPEQRVKDDELHQQLREKMRSKFGGTDDRE
jgi:Spy/CpxP family protein refolding chaperone